jgi:hypothetical protein
MQTLERTGISMGIDHHACKDFAGPLYLQLSRGRYGECSVLPLPTSIAAWRDEHRTARKRASRAERLGYRFAQIERERFSEDIYAINTSLDHRQGRPMTDAYRRPVEFGALPAYPCDEHRVNTYGVLNGETLVAYLWLYRVGELALVSSILGHGDHLANDVMYLLMQGTIAAELDQGGLLVYNRHDSGTDGLRYFKERCGFVETGVEWLP